MFAKTLSIVLAISLLQALAASSVLAQANLANRPDTYEKGETLRDDDGSNTANNASKEARFAAKIKTAIAKLGTGPGARVEIKLRDKTRLKGYVKATNDDSFAVVDDKTGIATEIPYPQVKTVKGNNLSTGAKIAIGVGVAVIVIFALLIANDKIGP